MQRMILEPEDIEAIKKVEQKTVVASGPSLNGRKKLSMVVKLNTEEVWFVVENKPKEPSDVKISRRWFGIDYAIKDFNSR